MGLRNLQLDSSDGFHAMNRACSSLYFDSNAAQSDGSALSAAAQYAQLEMVSGLRK
jgi:hypothetical protein